MFIDSSLSMLQILSCFSTFLLNTLKMIFSRAAKPKERGIFKGVGQDRAHKTKADFLKSSLKKYY